MPERQTNVLHKGHALFLMIAPIAYFGAAIYLRAIAGPFWQWSLLDPSYFYLLDGLNVLGGRRPGHVAHPGITVTTLAAAWLWIQQLGYETTSFVEEVLRKPEIYLHQLSTLYIALNTLLLAGVGWIAYRVFGVAGALGVQLAPFMSTIVLKHAFLPKPEAMLVAVTFILMMLTMLALRRSSDPRLAVAFGVIAGFGMVTKITAIPVFLIPLFVVGGGRTVLIYVVVAVVAAGVFFLPAVGALGDVISWWVHVAKGSGAHGAGPQTFIDLDTYARAVAKVFKRPALRVPVILSAVTLATVIWRSRRGGGVETAEVRCLIGILVAQMTHVLLVAKQPTAFYLIPSYMFSALSLVLSFRLLWSARPRSWRLPVTGTFLASLFVVGFSVGQANGLHRLSKHLEINSEMANAVDNARFNHCTQIFINAASTPVFAMFLADRVTGWQHSEVLKNVHPRKNFWIDDWLDQTKFTLRSWSGVHVFADVWRDSQCLFFRGDRANGIVNYLKSVAPGIVYDLSCTKGPEVIVTVGVDCEGKLAP